jgi:hypothetical protein
MAAGQRIPQDGFKNCANNYFYPAISDIVPNLGKNLGLTFEVKIWLIQHKFLQRFPNLTISIAAGQRLIECVYNNCGIV